MKLYAETPAYRGRQVMRDLGVALWTYVWIRVGMGMHDLVTKLAAPGRTIESAGGDLAGNFTSISQEVADVPVVGGALQAPFDAAARASRVLGDAGAEQQEVVMTFALWLGILLALIPILYLLMRYLPARWTWVRDASAAHMLKIDADDLQLFALRAIANRPLHELRKATPDPAGAMAAGDYEALAALELNALGLGTRTS